MVGQKKEVAKYKNYSSPEKCIGRGGFGKVYRLKKLVIKEEHTVCTCMCIKYRFIDS